MEQIKQVTDVVENVMKDMDSNKDGKISKDELKSWFSKSANIKLILGILISLIITPIITWFEMGLADGNWAGDGVFDAIKIIAPVFIILYIVKGSLESKDKDLKSKDETIALRTKEKDDADKAHMLDIQKYELNLKQMEGVVKCKDMEIDWLRKGYKEVQAPK